MSVWSFSFSHGLTSIFPSASPAPRKMVKSDAGDVGEADVPPFLASPPRPVDAHEKPLRKEEENDDEEEEEEEDDVEVGRPVQSLDAVLQYLKRAERRAEKQEEKIEARFTKLEQKLANIPLMVQQEYQKLGAVAAVAEVATLPDWLTSQDLCNAAQELGYWTRSGVKISERELGTLYRKLLDVVVLSEIVTEAQKAPYLGDDGELDEDKMSELVKVVKKWDAAQSKNLHEYFKASRTKRTEQLISIGGKDLALSRYYDIVLNCEADSDEQRKEQEIVRNKMIASKRHDNPEKFSEQGFKELYIYCCKMGAQFKMDEEEWKELMSLEPEHPRPQQVTFQGHMEKMFMSSTYKEGCKNLKIHERERKRVN